MYDAKKGYGLVFTKFDEQYEDNIIYRNSKEEIIRLADKILLTFNCQGLMSQLNDMQRYSMGSKIFENKFEIPAYFINLILSKYKMEVRGWE